MMMMDSLRLRIRAIGDGVGVGPVRSMRSIELLTGSVLGERSGVVGGEVPCQTDPGSESGSDFGGEVSETSSDL